MDRLLEDIVGDGEAWLWSDLGPLTLRAKTRCESKSSATSCSSCSTMDILILVRGDVGGDVGQGNGSGDLLAMVVFISVSDVWGSLWNS